MVLLTMTNRAPLAPEEWYHCYNRGVDKRRVFYTPQDYKRFIQALYLCNNTDPAHWDDVQGQPYEKVFQRKRGGQLVEIAAYSLMPNHFHLLIKSAHEKGIAKFMQKLGIAYTMYFNKKNERTGNLFMRPFRSRYVFDDRYFQKVVQYIHLNAVELFEPAWKEGVIEDFAKLRSQLNRYAYSSLPDYLDIPRCEKDILHPKAFALIQETRPDLEVLLPETAEYYRTLSWANREMTSRG